MALKINQSGVKKLEPWIQEWAIPEVVKQAEDDLNSSIFNRMWFKVFGVFKFKHYLTHKFTRADIEEVVK